MKSFLVVSLVLFALTVNYAHGFQLTLKDVTAPKDDKTCGVCVSFMGEAINELLNIIANVGVIGGCSDLCSYLGNKVEATVCDLLCSYVGIDVFIKLVQDADPDPIWLCEEIGICPINDDWSGNITSLSVSPHTGHQGSTFNINVVFSISNTTGTGELSLVIFPPDGFPFGDGQLLVDVAPATYSAQFQLQAQPSENEPFGPGTYDVSVALCDGGCGSSHSHARLISVQNTTFQISE